MLETVDDDDDGRRSMDVLPDGSGEMKKAEYRDNILYTCKLFTVRVLSSLHMQSAWSMTVAK